MNVTESRFKNRQLHIEDYLQMVSAEQKEYAEVFDYSKIAEKSGVITDYWTNNLLKLILRKDNLNNAYKQVKKNKGKGGIDGMQVDELPPCIHVGILNFNQMISPNYYHKISLMDEKTKELYSRKFQLHVIELKKLKDVKEKQKKKPLYRWAKLIAAQTWEELEQESKGNKYMERALEEMIKISQDEKERYLYLREEMAESDRVSQIESAQRLGRKEGIKEGKKEGDMLRLIVLVQKKIQKNKILSQIADEVEEDELTIQPIYETIKQNPKATKEEIYKRLNQ